MALVWSYVGNYAWIWGLYSFGEFIEDFGKGFSEIGSQSNDNRKANMLEAIAEILRIIPNSLYLLEFGVGLLLNKPGYQQNSLSDFLFVTGSTAMIISLMMDIFANGYGLWDNLANIFQGTYTGQDIHIKVEDWWDWGQIGLAVLLAGSTFLGIAIS